MKIYQVKSVEKQDDRRFYDIIVDVFKGSSQKSSCCSVCMITDREPIDQIRIILPYNKIKEIIHGKR